MTEKDKFIPEPSLKRLPLYHQVLKKYRIEGMKFVSCTKIAKELKLVPIQVRKDLNYTGINGYPKKGYILEELIKTLENYLGWNSTNEAFLVGTGHLGSALLGYEGFKKLGLNIVAAFDSHKKKVGNEINGIKILPFKEMPSLIKRMNIKIGIITTPWETAQDVADIMVQSGIKAIWNFAPLKLNVPDNIIIQEENLAASLAVISKRLEFLDD